MLYYKGFQIFINDNYSKPILFFFAKTFKNVFYKSIKVEKIIHSKSTSYSILKGLGIILHSRF